MSSRHSPSETERIGATIRALREGRGITVDELALLCGRSRPHLANIEAGRKRATPQLLRAVADALKVPLLALISDEYLKQLEDVA